MTAIRLRRSVPFALVALALVVGSIIAAGPARAGGPGKPPRAMTLIGSGAVVGIADLGQAGASPGDIRTLSLTLKTAKGATVGRAEIVQTLTRQADGLGTAVKSVVMTLTNGAVTASGTTTFSDFTSPNGRPDDRIEQIAITGGTGRYDGASGSVDITILPEFRSEWVLRFSQQ